MPTWTKPVTLVANTNENVNDLNAIVDDIYSRANGGLDETNVPNLAAAFTSYKQLARGAAQVTNSTGTFALLVGEGVAANTSNPLVGGGFATPADSLLELDPADFNANTRTTKLRLRFTAVTNAVAPAVNYTAGLYPIATYGGAAGAGPTIATVGTVVTGSTAVISTPAAAGRATPAVSTDFNFPAAGAYLLGVVPSGAAAVNAVVHLIVTLEFRQV